MKKYSKVLKIGFALFSSISSISSFLFVFYAVNIAFSPMATPWLKTFAYVTGGYGLLNIYILSWAWRSKISWAASADFVIAACFLGVCVMDYLRDGLTRGTAGLAVLLVLALMLALNWYAIILLNQHHQ